MATGDFKAAVDILVEGGLHRDAAHLLICRALERAEPMGLVAWAEHLLEEKATFQRKYAKTVTS